MKSSIYVKRQSFEVRLNSVISFVSVAFCQPRILRYSARDITDIFAMKFRHLVRFTRSRYFTVGSIDVYRMSTGIRIYISVISASQLKRCGHL